MSSCRIVFCGSVDFSRHCLEVVLAHGGDVVAVLTRRRADDEFNADHADLAPVATSHGIPVHFIDSINAVDAIDTLRRYAPDLLFVWGWSEIARDTVLAVPSRGAIGVHPTLLPANRGRHPLIWTLQLGLRKTGLTFFWMDRGADSGDILAQSEMALTENETARSLYERIERSASCLVPTFLPQLIAGTAPRIPQHRSSATSWRRRSREDGRVDFRMSSGAIERLVRALGPPYPGAHVSLAGRDVKVWRVRVAPLPGAYENAEFGRVLGVDGRHVLVRADDALVTLVDHEFDPLPAPGSYL